MPPEIIDGGTFSFLIADYTTHYNWQGESYIFPRKNPNIYQIYIDSTYVYTANHLGMDVFDIASELHYANATTTSGYTTVAGDDTNIYLGTSASGIKTALKACISGSVESPYELAHCVTDYLTFPYIESNNINYLHASGDFIGIVLASGTKVAGSKKDPQGYYGSTTLSGGQVATKCHITSNGYIYYIVTTSGEAMVSKSNVISNWDQPFKSYVAGGSIMASGIVPRDIFVTEGTASDGLSNTLFIATTSGSYIIDEYSEDYAVYYTS